MRLFIAIDLDERVRGEIAKVINRLEKGGFDVKWVEPRNVHITLKFLGEVREDLVAGVKERVSGVLRDVKGFSIRIGNLGYFGSPGYVRVIWVDILEGRESLVKLSGLLDRELGDIRKSEHGPSPHLTIGRVRSGRKRDELLREIRYMKDVKLCELDVNDVKLKRSVLDEGGPVYSDLEVFRLASSGSPGM
jgi:2'-5' RNA ligase